MIRHLKLWLVAWLLPVLVTWRDDPALSAPDAKEPVPDSLVGLVTTFLMAQDGNDRVLFENYGHQASLIFKGFLTWVDDPSFTCLPGMFGRAMRQSGMAVSFVRNNAVYFKATPYYVAKRMVRP